LTGEQVDLAETPAQIARLLSRSYPGASGISWLFIWLRPFICPFEKLLAAMPGSGSYLDVGCGIGIMSVLLARVKAARRIVGFDTSQNAIDVARAAVLPQTTQATFHRVDANEAWPHDRVDNVVCLDVLHHVPAESQRDFIRRLARANFSHAVYFKDVSPHPRWKAWGSHIHDFVVSQEFIHIRAEEEVKEWFEEEGLTVSGPRRLDTLWYTHYFLVASRKAS
jgi:cyclopropane fatty-acyl-phospholipid synthase-like methyltransferase